MGNSTRSFAADRAELLAMLRADGVLRHTEATPVLGVDGRPASWMLDTLSVTMNPRAAVLAARCLLEVLERFEGSQLATYGVIGLPLLQSCVALSGGRYHGLYVRKQPKSYGACRRVEGRLDLSEPVIMLDDSVVSGRTMQRCKAHLEAAGLRVEGGVCLVRFGYPGFGRLQSLGLHMESVFDRYADGLDPGKRRSRPELNPTRALSVTPVWSQASAPEGLHPAELARRVLRELFRSGRLLRPPARLDAPYDSAGGVFVSVRPRSNLRARHARRGFWRLPEEPRVEPVSAARDLVISAFQTWLDLRRLPDPAVLLGAAAIAVTFFRATEACEVGGLDNDRYGVIVRSLERPRAAGGALPRMPGFARDWRQLSHARFHNAKLFEREPFELFRHELVKVVERGVTWLENGAPAPPERAWIRDPVRAGRVARRALDLLLSRRWEQPETTSSLPPDLLPEPVDWVYLRVSESGRVVGSFRGRARGQVDLEGVVQALVDAAARADGVRACDGGAGSVAVQVWFLYHCTEFRGTTAAAAAPYVCVSHHAVRAARGARARLVPPWTAGVHSLSGLALAQHAISSAGIESAPFVWRRFDHVGWVASSGRVAALEGCVPIREAAPVARVAVATHRRLLLDYLLRMQRDDGTFFCRYAPFLDRRSEGVLPPHLAHAAWLLARATRRLDAAHPAHGALERTLGCLLEHVTEPEAGDGGWLGFPGHAPTIAEVGFLLLALCELPDRAAHGALVEGLVGTLLGAIDRHGRMRTHRDPGRDTDGHQDYSPAQALLALGRAAEVGVWDGDDPRIAKALRYYRHRFLYRRSWGHIAWFPQAFSVWWRRTGDAGWRDLVFQVADWALKHQSHHCGGFITGHQRDAPGCMTAVYLEGIAAAFALAHEVGDAERRERYAQACEGAVRFVDRLIYQERDAVVLPRPGRALGGIRQSLVASIIQIDFVQHALAATSVLDGLWNPGLGDL